MSRLQDKISIVTGGGEGIGAGIATTFAENGATVVVVVSSIFKIAVSEPPQEVKIKIKTRSIDILFKFLNFLLHSLDYF